MAEQTHASERGVNPKATLDPSNDPLHLHARHRTCRLTKVHRTSVATATATAVIVGQGLSRNLRSVANTVRDVRDVPPRCMLLSLQPLIHPAAGATGTAGLAVLTTER